MLYKMLLHEYVVNYYIVALLVNLGNITYYLILCSHRFDVITIENKTKGSSERLDHLVRCIKN